MTNSFSNLRTRLYSSFASNLYGQAVTTFIQLLTFPIYLGYWDLSTFGKWIIATSIPGYLLLLDIGLTATIANKVSIARSSNKSKDYDDAITALSIYTYILATVVVAAGATVAFSLPAIILSNNDIRIALAAMCATAAGSLMCGKYEALWRAAGKYSTITAILNTIRLLEWTAGCTALIIFGSFASVAIFTLTARIACTIALEYYSRTLFPSNPQPKRCADSLRLVLHEIPIASKFLAFPISNALNINGLLFLYGLFFGPVAVVAFSAARTLSRVIVQFITAISRAIWPEFTLAFGRNDQKTMALLAHKGLKVCSLTSTILGILCLAVAPLILQEWTHSKVGFQLSVMGPLVLAASLVGFWQTGYVVLTSTNNIDGYAASVVATAFFTTTLILILGEKLGAEFFAWAIVGNEVAMIFITRKFVRIFFSSLKTHDT